MRTAICYFSGTGNSLDISNKLLKVITGDLFYIPNTQADELADYERIILVTPIYSFGLPIPTKSFISSLSNFHEKDIHVILHYGGFSANAAHYTKELFAKYGISVSNIYKMKMPENFTIVSTVPNFYINAILKKSNRTIEMIARKIESGQKREIHKNLFSFCDSIHEKNALKWPELPRNFLITDECTNCGYCESVCPAKNISVSGKKPEFHGNCFSCLACYHRCPVHAINYGIKTVGRMRYQNPNVDLSKMT